MEDLRTPAEVAYDALASGAAYAKPAPVQTTDDMHRAQIDCWNRMNEDDRLFAAVVTRWYDNLAPTHQAMGQAGMILLGAAVDAVGPEDTDADEQEQIAARIHHAAYQQGYDEGLRDGAKRLLVYLQGKLETEE